MERTRRVLVPAVRALVAQWIERSPAEAEAVGSNPAERAILSLQAAGLRPAVSLLVQSRKWQ